MGDKFLNQILSVASVILAILATVMTLRSAGLDERPTTGLELFLFGAALGAAASFLHGIIWVGIEKLFRTNFLSSTYRGAPRGAQAVLLSVSLTLPLVILPVLWQLGTGLQILRPRPVVIHLLAMTSLIGGGIIAHLIMYGTHVPSIPGLKQIIYPAGQPNVTYKVAIATELIYAVVFFPLMVVPYRLVLGVMGWQGIGWTITFALGWFCAVSGYILFVGRPAIANEHGVALRGMLSAIFLEVALMESILM